MKKTIFAIFLALAAISMTAAQGPYKVQYDTNKYWAENGTLRTDGWLESYGDGRDGRNGLRLYYSSGVSGTFSLTSAGKYQLGSGTAVSATEFGYLSGVTSAIQTQISSKIGLTSLSSTATGLTYTNTTGVFSLTSGYAIPTTSQLATPIFDHATSGAVFVGKLTSVYIVGDSLSTESSGRWGQRLKASIGASYAIRNRAVAGRTADEVRTNLTTDVLQYGNANYVAVWAGINDVKNGVSAADVEADLQAVYTACRAAGAKVIALTISPFKGLAGWTSDKQTALEAVNTWIKTAATGVDYIYDAYAALVDPGNAYTLLAAYDSGDHIHLTDAGYDLVGDGVYAAATWTGYGSTRGYLDIPVTSNGLFGTITQNGRTLIHTYADATADGFNVFAFGAGNYSLSPAGGASTLASYNVGIGYAAGYALTTGAKNLAIGYLAGTAVTSGTNNLAIGARAGKTVSTGMHNIAISEEALYSSNANYSLAIGYRALRTSTGNGMLAVGYNAGYGTTTTNAPAADSYGILIGYAANRSVASATTLTNYVGIGYGTLIDKSNQVKIGNANIVETQLYGTDLHYTGGDATFDADEVHASTLGDTLGGEFMVFDSTNGKVGIYRIEGGTITLISANAVFALVKDNAATINVYYESNVIKIQNKTAGSLALKYRFNGIGA